jgi:hypothetical protein
MKMDPSNPISGEATKKQLRIGSVNVDEPVD